MRGVSETTHDVIAHTVITAPIDGVVIYGVNTDDPRVPALHRHGIPFAAFGRTGHDSAHPWVDVDNAAGTTSAVEHLVARGHRRIGFVGYPEGSAVGDRRAEGWRTALDKRGLLADCHHLDLRGEDSLANGVQLGGLLLDSERSPTAIVAATDTLAAGVLRAVHARGVQVAVVGFDDTPTAAVLDMSSVRQPIEAAGHAMIRALLRGPFPDLDGPGGQLLAPELIVRATSAGHAPGW